MVEYIPLITNLDYEENEEKINEIVKNNQNQKRYIRKSIFIVCLLIILITNVLSYLIYKNYKNNPIPEFKNYASSEELNMLKKNKYPKKLLIFVVSSEPYLTTRTIDVVNTWQRTANILEPELGIYVVISIESDIPKLYGIPMLDNISPSNYNDLYIKVFDSWKEVWDKYGYEFDYFMKADDDLFVKIRKLSHAFNNISYDPNRIEYFGFYENNGFMCWGGPGYILSRAAVRLIYPNIEYCKKTFQTAEDISLSQCIDYSYKLIYNKQFEGCKNIHGMNGTEFLSLSENDFNWKYWNNPNEQFTLSWTGNNKEWSFKDIITVHSTKPKDNKNITMQNLNQIYNR
jgi:hypothetical protein